MKKLTQHFALFLLTLCLSFGAIQASPNGSEATSTKTSKIRLLSGKTVRLGNAITALFQSNQSGKAQIMVETVKGNRLLDQNIDLDQGYNLVKLKVAGIPAGFYIISLKTDGGTEKMPIIVK